MDEQTTQSAELLKIEANGLASPEVVAVLKSHQSQLDLLLGMVEKLTPTAEMPWEPTMAEMKQAYRDRDPRSDPPATPQPACEAQKHIAWGRRRLIGNSHEWCGLCGALWDGSTWLLPTTPAPQQTEG